MSILSNNRIALLFVAFAAATGPASGTRNLKSSSKHDAGEDHSKSHSRSNKGQKGSKHPKGQCVEVFSIDGPIEPQGFTGFLTECCIDVGTNEGACVADLQNDPPTLVPFDQDCIADYFLTYPFGHTFAGVTDSYQFTEEDAFLGKGSFKGTIPLAGTGSEKIRLIYNSMEYNAGKNDELWGRSVADLEYIEYSFKAGSCGSAGTPCPGKFYLNVYTRVDASSENFYDCSYDFAPTTGGIEGEGWTTVRFDIDTQATNTKTFVDPPNSGDRSRCPTAATANDPLDVAAKAGYVLGTNEQPSGSGMGQIFALNMGDSTLSDVGLSGYFDRVIIKMMGEEPRIYDLEPES
mmetsp:Transcript_20635/g.30440  ORF Transcript_20635/g.30440 Transcript_20635/m.30440 type:complete len:348 (-) Transcript_20635:178-1221(-)